MTWYHDLALKKLDGSPLGDELADKVLLVVNVATYCGFTPQYEGLVALHHELAKDFAVVGVPCNQFGAQEPGSADDIATFCSTHYNVDFPLLAKQDVNGAERSPLYRHLIGDGPDIRWNFEKFVVDRAGRVRARFGSRTRPEDAVLRTAVVDALG